MHARRRWLFSLLGLCLAPLLALAWTFVPRPLTVPDGELMALPEPARVAGVRLWRLPTAKIETLLALSVRGAPPTAPVTSALTAFVVEHPQGTVLIDAGIATEGHEHMAVQPALMRAVAKLDLVEGTGAALAARGLGTEDLWGVLLTHGHWDHVSGLADLAGVTTWMPSEELAHVRTHESGEVFRAIDAESPVAVRELRLDGPAHGPFSRSWDVFGDGAVVVVPMPGHTPGSVGVLVRPEVGAPALFIGDTAWVREGVDWPSEKPWLSRRLVDADPAGVREQLAFLHRLQARHPELTLVPAHDARVHATMAVLPAR
ncbi:MAG: MBL fold metallo-hydrolase [Deltaproteobacteria bacterium]|nr:MAG: MBL fold metallo-hydrolase [Deltaproteobacteria bacterium]